MTRPAPVDDPRPSIGALLADPAVRRPLKRVLRQWRDRDPADAAEDAGLLALALERLADERCAHHLHGCGWPRDWSSEGGDDDREPA